MYGPAIHWPRRRIGVPELAKDQNPSHDAYKLNLLEFATINPGIKQSY